MRRALLALFVALLATAGLSTDASGHPLGNFTVNTYLRVEASGGELYLRHVVDMAEVPALRERRRVDAAGGAQAYADSVARTRSSAVDVRVDGRPLAVAPLSQTAAFRAGEGGLDVLRYAAWYRVLGPPTRPVAVTVGDRNFAERLGWREIVVRGSSGARVSDASVSSEDRTDELSRYPDGRLDAPERTESATFDLSPGRGPGDVASLTGDPGAPAPSPERDGLSGLVGRDLAAGSVIFSLLLAMGWGALHSLSPGHGKTMVAAYLVGTRGRSRHALLLGLFVTATHTVGVVALGLVTLLASRYVLPETLFPWIDLAAALLVVGIGCWALRVRARAVLATRRPRLLAAAAPAPAIAAPAPAGVLAHAHGPDIRARDGHDHHHDAHDDAGHRHADHDHGPGAHTHTPPDDLSMRSLVAVGASAGLIPCPSALVLLLGAIALGRAGYGLVLVLAFSVGLAALLSLIGLAILHARRLVDRLPLDGRLVAAVPVASAVVIVALGVVLTARAIPPLV